MGHYDIPDDVEIDTETSATGEVEDGVGFVCNQCKLFVYAEKERTIPRDYRRHANSTQYSHEVGDYKSAYVEDGEVKKL